MKTAGTAGQAGVATGEGRPIIFLSSGDALDECLKILFQRQRWFLNGWNILYGHQEYTLPQLEIRLEFENERILVAFFKPGKALGLALTAQEFSRVVVIMDGVMSLEDEAELSMLGRVLSRQGKKLGVVNGIFLNQKFSCYIFGHSPEKMLENFFKDLGESLNGSSTFVYEYVYEGGN